jgi:hypothetical protein
MRWFNAGRGMFVGIGVALVMLAAAANASAVRLQLNLSGSRDLEGINQPRITFRFGENECAMQYNAINNNDRGTITDTLVGAFYNTCGGGGAGFSALKLSWNGLARTVGEETVSQEGCTYRFHHLAATAKPPFSYAIYEGSATGVLERKVSLLSCPGSLVATSLSIRLESRAVAFAALEAQLLD